MAHAINFANTPDAVIKDEINLLKSEQHLQNGEEVSSEEVAVLKLQLNNTAEKAQNISKGYEDIYSHCFLLNRTGNISNFKHFGRLWVVCPRFTCQDCIAVVVVVSWQCDSIYCDGTFIHKLAFVQVMVAVRKGPNFIFKL